jgi:branched-chain amino acid transport system substrate-binding protein
MRSKRAIGGSVIILAAVAITVAGCSSDPSGGSGSSADTSPIKIAVAAPFSGSSAALGQYVVDGFQYAMKKYGPEVGGRPIELVKADTQCTPSVAVQAIQQLLADNPVAGVGDPCSGDTAAIRATLLAHKIPVVSANFLANLTTNDPYMYRSEPNSQVLNDAFAKYISESGVKEIGIIHDNTDYGQGCASTMVDGLKKVGISPVSDIEYSTSDTDFSGQILTLKRAGVKALYVEGYATQIAQLIVQIRQLGLNVPIYTSEDAAEGLALKTGGSAMNGIIFATDYVPGSDDLAKAFESSWKEQFGSLPDSAEEILYEPEAILINAIQHAARPVTSESINQAIAATDMQLPSGTVKFQSDHERLSPQLEIGTVKSGETVLVKHT